MSWDVLLLRLAKDVRAINDLPDDFAAESLGSPAEVAATLKALFPAIDLTDPTWAVLIDDDYSIEFSIGDANPCTSLMLHVRGTESVIKLIRSLCERTAWRAFDTTDGKLLDFSKDPAKGLREWIAYRAQVAPDAPIRGVALPIEGKGVVFFDADPRPARRRKKWWQFWRT